MARCQAAFKTRAIDWNILYGMDNVQWMAITIFTQRHKISIWFIFPFVFVAFPIDFNCTNNNALKSNVRL